MQLDRGTEFDVTSLLQSTIAAAPGTASESFDTSKGRFTLVVIHSGTQHNETAESVLEDSADDSSFSTVAGAPSLSHPDEGATARAVRSWWIDHRAVRRYVRVLSTKAGGGSCRHSTTAITFGGHSDASIGATEVVA